MLTIPGRPRSSANYYKEHLLIRVLSHTLNSDEDEESNLSEQVVRSSSPESFEVEDKVEVLPKHSADDTRRSSGFTSKLSSKLKQPHESATVERGWDDVENIEMAETTTFADYGSRYATYVRTISHYYFRIRRPLPLFRNKGT